jgi:hypothetical protein
MDPQVPNIQTEPAEVFPTPSGTPLDAPGATQPGQLSKKKERDGHWISILAMAVFVVLSLGVVAFMYYQNQALKSMLASLQTPVASSTPTASPSASPSATPDTAGWKTYTNTKLGFSIQYPPGWKQNYNPNVSQVNLVDSSTTSSVSLTWSQHAADQGNAGGCTSPCNSTAKDGSYTWILLKQLPGTTDNTGFIISASTYPDISDNRGIVDQILSTFEFTEATPSASPSPSPIPSATP